MKSTIFLFFTVILISCTAEKDFKSEHAIVNLPEKVYDFGEISMTDSIEHKFSIVNLGSTDLILNEVSASCGCTVPSWNRESIPPNEKGFVNVVFKPVDEGQVEKLIILEMNTDSTFAVLRIKGFVIK